VLNWMTQGVMVAIVAAAGLRVIPLSRPRARYAVVWAAYLLVVVLPAVAPVFAWAVDPLPADLAPSLPLVTVPGAWWASPAAALALWVAWAGMHIILFARAAAAVQRAKRSGRECPREVLAGLRYWTRVSSGGRPARVVLSDSVRLAGVLAFGRPAIAIAPPLVGQLNSLDLDRVLVHEWAHVQRRDDIGQLVQRLFRIVVGWHPAAWWLERQLDFEREAACDELAVSVTGSAKGYAGCLALLAALPQASGRSVPALAVLSRSRLHRRVVRILRMPYVAVQRPWRAVTACTVTALFACTVTVAHVHVAGFTGASAVISTTATIPFRTFEAAQTVTTQSQEPTRVLAVPVRRGGSRRTTLERVVGESARSAEVMKPRGIEPTSPSAGALPLTESADVPLPLPLSASTVSQRSESDVSSIDEVVSLAARPPAIGAPPGTPRSLSADQAQMPWTRAADSGIALGRASQGAGIATAGLFTRFGKRIAGSF
jgi:beta-lactamase regulating signal transducer with metallopeptidase domain